VLVVGGRIADTATFTAPHQYPKGIPYVIVNGQLVAIGPIGAEPIGIPAILGADLSPHLDLAKARRPGREVQRVNVDFPLDLLREIDGEARRIGVSRQAFIKLRLADVLSGR
jgi:hypothetical protein